MKSIELLYEKTRCLKDPFFKCPTANDITCPSDNSFPSKVMLFKLSIPQGTLVGWAFLVGLLLQLFNAPAGHAQTLRLSGIAPANEGCHILASVALVQSCPPNQIPMGSVHLFNGYVTNTGIVALTNVFVFGPAGTNAPVLGPIDLAPGASAAYSGSYAVPFNIFEVIVTAVGQGICCGKVATYAATCPVDTTPVLTITQDCPDNPTIPGGVLTFSGTVSNAGNITLTGIVVTNNLSGNIPLVTVASLAPGQSANYTGSYITPATGPTTSTSTAYAMSLSAEPVMATASSTCEVLCAVTTVPGISITQGCPPNPVSAGSLVVFGGMVSNSGNVTLTNILVFSSQPSNSTPVLGPITLTPGAFASFTGSYIASGGSNPTTNSTIITNSSDTITTNEVSAITTNNLVTITTNAPTQASFGTIDSVAGTVVDRFNIGTDFHGLTYASEDHGYTATQFYSLRQELTGTSFFDTITASTATTADRFDASNRAFDALAYAAPDLGFGPTIFYYLTHDLAGVSTFGSITPGGVVGVIADRFVAGNNFDALTFCATDVGYGANLFYYVRHDETGLSTFGTINPALPGTITDRFTIGNNVHALVFTDLIAPGYGPNNFYYLRHDENGVSTFGTILVTGLTTATVTDRFIVGPNASELTFTATDVGFGANLFYFLRASVPDLTTNLITTFSTNIVTSWTTNTVTTYTTNTVVSFTAMNIVLAIGQDICQGSIVVASASCLGPVNPVAPASFLCLPTIINGVFTLSCPSENGKSYTVQYKNSLEDPVWIDLETVAGTGGNLIITDLEASQQSARFYRVMTTPTPY